MKNYYIASVSFGKDSLAMLLKLIKSNYPLDEVIYYNTGMEFKAIYNIRDKILEILDRYNIKFTELKPNLDFEYKMFNKPVKHRNGTIGYGYSWCGGKCRWGTSDKLQAIKKYYRDTFPARDCIIYEYVGIAFDEQSRAGKGTNKLYPLIDWKMTEKDCLDFCYSEGFTWEEDGIELYDILDRVSCWCCANKNKKELKNYYLYLPNYWNKLLDMQRKTERPFSKNINLLELDKIFREEDKDVKN